jgi:hypothetical protein
VAVLELPPGVVDERHGLDQRRQCPFTVDGQFASLLALLVNVAELLPPAASKYSTP